MASFNLSRRCSSAIPSSTMQQAPPCSVTTVHSRVNCAGVSRQLVRSQFGTARRPRNTHVILSVAATNHVVDNICVSDYDATIEAAKDKLVVIDYYTDWCGPCKMMVPALERMAADYSDKVVMYKFNCGETDDSKRLAMAKEIKVLPTFHLFKNSVKVAEMRGAKSEELRKLIEKHM